MEAVESVLKKHADAFKITFNKGDEMLPDVIRATAFVKQFIIDHNLIVYGGTAIDYALRQHGDSIYSDDTLDAPDLDFYSPDNVKNAYTLADILFDAGFPDTRAIVGQYMRIMKVDIGQKHIVADVAFMPEGIFDILPTLTIDGMRMIHPTYQRIDQHNSLAFPFDDAPREVIFNRWNKDVERFNKINRAYPLVANPNMAEPLTKISIPKNIRRFVAHGFFAYALIHNQFVCHMKELKHKIPPNILESNLTHLDDEINFMGNGICELVDMDLHKACESVGLTDTKFYSTFVNMLPERVEGKKDNVEYIIYSTHNQLLSINTIVINSLKHRCANVQYVLKYMLSKYVINKTTHEKLAEMYLYGYTSLLLMISALEEAIVAKFGDNMSEAIEFAKNSALFLSITTFGFKNINMSQEAMLKNQRAEIFGEIGVKPPVNYYPGRRKPGRRDHPPFDPENIVYYREDGRLIT